MTKRVDSHQKLYIAKEFSATGVVGPAASDSAGAKVIRVVVENAGATNAIVVKGKLRDQAVFQMVATIIGSRSGTLIDVSMFDTLEFSCSVYSASGGTPKLIVSAFHDWPKLANFESTHDLDADFTTPSIDISGFLFAGVQIAATTPDSTGQFTIQVSNDDVTFDDLTLDTAIPALAGADKNIMVNVAALGFGFMRTKFVAAGGTDGSATIKTFLKAG